MSAALQAHLATGATHVCHCWAVTRRDGRVLGFTDHDRPIVFDGITFQPETGLSARALSSTTGLSVNNSEAIGALSAAAITEADITAGRYDGAEVATWLVQWDDPAARQLRFVGTIGEITRAAGGFQADLRGLTEPLNQPQGRSYMTTCSAVLGEGRCGVDLADPAFSVTLVVDAVAQGQQFRFTAVTGFNDRWCEGGFLEVLTGAATGLREVIKHDRISADARAITLWQPIRGAVAAGDQVRLIAGCDRRAGTCAVKFANLINFQGFPHIPGEDWLTAVPRSDGQNTGESRTR
ncbi:DUF2163 domain-containing protein [Yoonia sp.]|uniref:DUF2163 domain-containing protein n=1 Tax=Yoonia sp. TaxID=2212373 RepID=UPI003F6B2070